MQAPFQSDYINAINNKFQPSTVHVADTQIQRFFERYFLQRAMSVFRFTLPVEWSESLFLYTLFVNGYVGVFNTDKYGVVANPCGLTGYNVNYQPTNIIVSNPLIRGTVTPAIGIDCELIRLQPNYSGVMDIVGVYSNACALAFEAQQINMANSKTAYIATAGDKAEAETFKKAFDAVQRGDPFVVTRGKKTDDRPLDLFFQNVKSAYIANDLHLTLRKYEQDFDRWIGVPTANTEKKERLTDDEVNIGGVETRSCVDLWFDTLSKSVERVRDMFALSPEQLSVSFRYSANKEVLSNDDTVDIRTLQAESKSI